MSTFEYFKKTGEYTREIDGVREWDGDEGYYINYTPDPTELRWQLARLLRREYFGECGNIYDIEDRLSDMIVELDLEDTLTEAFYDELHDIFEHDALDEE